MELLFALGATVIAATYAVVLGRGIEKRRRWAIETARAVSLLNPSSGDRYTYEALREAEALSDEAEDESNESSNNPSRGGSDRLAA